MKNVIQVSVVVLLIAGCATGQAPRASCSGRLEEINAPARASAHMPAESEPKAPAP